MERAYEEAFAEIDEIFKIMPIDLLSKIPIQFRKIISENKAKNYKVNIQEPLKEENLKGETVIILGLIYRDFLASPEEKEELQTQDAEELHKIEEEMQQKYNIENILKKRKNGDKEENISQEMVVYEKKGLIQKILNFFKKMFNKNKI